MWFSPIKGHYPSLGQLDKTLPVQSGNETIERGMVLEMVNDDVNADGAFKIAATAAEGKLLYVSLQDYTDAQAGMAGTTGFDADVPSHTEGNITIPGVKAQVPTVTGLSLDMEGEYETDAFKDITEAAKIGDGLTVANGFFKLASGGDTVVAYLTGKPYTRWINNAAAKSAGNKVVRQGANKTVIRFRTK